MSSYTLTSYSFDDISFSIEKKNVEECVFQTPLLELFRAGNTINPEIPSKHFLVRLNEKAVGTITAYHHKDQLILGNYACIDDDFAAKYLFDGVIDYAKKIGSRQLIGPMNGSTWDNYRFCKSPTSAEYFSEPPQQPWFIKQWEDNGFVEIEQYYTAIDKNLTYDLQETLKLKTQLNDKQITIRKINLNDYQSELSRLWKFSTSVFKNNVLYSPISEKYFIEKYNRLQSILHPETTLIAENKDRQVVGLIFCFDDRLCKTEKRLVIKTIARDGNADYKGIPQVFMNQVIDYARMNNYKSILHAFIHIKNRSSQLSKQFSGTPWKYYSLYQLEL